jgi:putative ABC transport system permease protein
MVVIMHALLSISDVTGNGTPVRPRQIGGLVLAHGLTLAGLGVGIGLALAAGASRALTSLLYETPPLEPRIFLGLSALLLTIAALACYVPARRAMRVDPAQALRGE